MKLDKEDKFYEIKLQTLKTERLNDLESSEKFEQRKKKNKKQTKLIDFTERKNEALTNQKVKSLIDFDEQYSSSIRSIPVEKSSKVNLKTIFLNGKMLMFSKLSIKSFVYDLIDVFMFPNQEIKKIYVIDKINRCYLYQNLTNTDSASVFFAFICDLSCCISEDEARDISFEVMIQGKIFDRLDLSTELWERFNSRNEDLKKQAGLFEIENIDKPNVITIALNPKEYYERLSDHSNNKKHKGLKKSTRGMDFDFYSERLADLNEFSKNFSRKPAKIEQKRFQIINKSMQMKSVVKVQFGQLNDKRFYFSNGHPYLEELRKEKHKYQAIHKVIQEKNTTFLRKKARYYRSLQD